MEVDLIGFNTKCDFLVRACREIIFLVNKTGIIFCSYEVWKSADIIYYLFLYIFLYFTSFVMLTVHLQGGTTRFLLSVGIISGTRAIFVCM